jgi:alpha-tubulin suppressor-like RCC1 family protein
MMLRSLFVAFFLCTVCPCNILAETVAPRIAAGANHTVVLLSDGTLKAWGSNLFGQLGDGTNTSSNTPVTITGLGGTVLAVAAGGNHTLALMSDGTVKAWGSNLFGQLGDGTNTSSNTPVTVTGLVGTAIAVAAGANHSVVLMSDGSLKTWGSNLAGQLGTGDTASSSTPNSVSDLLGKTVISVAAGADHTLALIDDGSVTAWGSNLSGQIGDGATTGSRTPIAITGLGGTAVAVSAGDTHSIALMADGSVKGWGGNLSGQLGSGTTSNSKTPVAATGLYKTIIAVSAGGGHTIALMTDGTVMAWGGNLSGQLGNGTTVNSSLPVAVNGLGATAVALSAGSSHSVAIMADGTVKGWGSNQFGQLGNGGGTVLTPVVALVNLLPVPVPLHDITATVTGGNGTVTCTPSASHGTNANCAIMPAAGYKLANFTDNGINTRATVSGNTYLILNVVANHDIAATFSLNPPLLPVKIDVSGRVLDARDVPVDGATVSFSGISDTLRTNPHGYFCSTLFSGSYLMSITKEGVILKEKNITVSPDNGPVNLGDIKIEDYLQPEVWPPKITLASYGGLASAAITQYISERQDYTPYIAVFEPFGNYLNASKTFKFVESDRIKFDENGIPKVKYGTEYYYNPVTVSHHALYVHGCYLNGTRSLNDFLLVADKLIDMQGADGAMRYDFPFLYYVTGKTYNPGWVSGMAQGLVMSVFARAYKLTGLEKYLNAGKLALDFLCVPISNGGVYTTLQDLHPSLVDYISFEEYTATPATYTLNGFMFTLLGLYSWWQVDPSDNSGSHKVANYYFLKGITTIEKTLSYYDLGGVSNYDLSYINYGIEPHFSSYHKVHIYLLHALSSVTGSSILKGYENLWATNVLSGPPPIALNNSFASPTSAGLAVTFTAAICVAGNYEYKYLLGAPGSALTVVRNYSTVPAWTWTTTGLAPGSYQVVVHARKVGSTASYETYKTINFVLMEPTNSVALTPAPASPAATGTPVTFTAAANGGSGSYQYKFLLKAPGGALQTVQDYSTTATWTWTTADLAPGSYQVVVYARNVGSTKSYETFNSINSYLLTIPPASSVTLTPALASPSVTGTPVTFTAVASGGSGSYQYKFLLKAPGGSLQTVRDYSTETTWTWTTADLAPGSYQVVVYARNVGSTKSYETFNSINSYLLTITPAASVTLTPAPATPAIVGTPITFTASASGGSGSYQYKFLLKAPGGALQTVQDYSATAIWTWMTADLAPGSYQVVVYARNVGSTMSYEAFRSINSDLLADPPAASVTLTPAPASPSVTGTPVTFTAVASGGSGSYQYKFLLKAPGGSLQTVRDYSATATWTWTTTGLAPGSYQVVVHARNVGSTRSYETFNSVNAYLLTEPPATSATLTPTQASSDRQ